MRDVPLFGVRVYSAPHREMSVIISSLSHSFFSQIDQLQFLCASRVGTLIRFLHLDINLRLQSTVLFQDGQQTLYDSLLRHLDSLEFLSLRLSDMANQGAHLYDILGEKMPHLPSVTGLDLQRFRDRGGDSGLPSFLESNPQIKTLMTLGMVFWGFGPHSPLPSSLPNLETLTFGLRDINHLESIKNSPLRNVWIARYDRIEGLFDPETFWKTPCFANLCHLEGATRKTELGVIAQCCRNLQSIGTILLREETV